MSRRHEREERYESRDRRERPGVIGPVLLGLGLIAAIVGSLAIIVWRMNRMWAETSLTTRSTVSTSIKVIVGILLAWLIFSIAYSLFRRIQRDNIDIEAERLARVEYWRAQVDAYKAQNMPARFEQLPADDHGLLGAVIDKSTGLFLNLDTGHVLSANTERAGDPELLPIAARSKAMAALTGTSVTARQITQDLADGTTMDRELRFAPLIEEPRHDGEVIEL